MSHFLSLPPEVRAIIYEFCLVVEKIRPYQNAEYEYGEKYCMVDTDERIPSSERPTIALVKVCKLFRQEGEPILYARNTFVMPTFGFSNQFFSCCLHTKQRRSWLKSVRVELNQLDMKVEDRKRVFREHVRELEPHFTDLCEVHWRNAQRDEAVWDFTKELHRGYKKHLIKNIWPAKMAPILDDSQLDELCVDVRGTTCPDTCCEMGRCALQALREGFANGLPKNLIIIGRFKDAEKGIPLVTEWTEEREKRKLGPSEALHLHAKLAEECREEYFSDGTWGDWECGH